MTWKNNGIQFNFTHKKICCFFPSLALYVVTIHMYFRRFPGDLQSKCIKVQPLICSPFHYPRLYLGKAFLQLSLLMLLTWLAAGEHGFSHIGCWQVKKLFYAYLKMHYLSMSFQSHAKNIWTFPQPLHNLKHLICFAFLCWLLNVMFISVFGNVIFL